ncbi:MAG TPA: BTAD domain-containing putative transcriptional regulator, partial [Actinomycetes bacterium]
RLDELHTLAVEHRAEAALALGLAAETVPDLEPHAAAHPLREEAWRLLALALYRSGRQGDALATLRRARATLADELGVDPGPALTRLEAAVRTQSAELDWVPPSGASPRPVAEPGRTAPVEEAPAADVPAADVPVEAGDTQRAVPFVGRAAELAVLSDVAAGAGGAGGTGLVLLEGEPGAGKSTLLERFAAERRADGWRVAWGRCPEVEGAPAGWPWVEVLRGLAADVPPGEELAADLAPLLTDGVPVPENDSGAARFHLHRAATTYLGAVATRTPLLVVLDDLHRADDESLALLGSVVGGAEAQRVLVVVAFRGAEVGPGLAAALAELARHSPARLTLGGLSETEVAELVAAVADASVDPVTAAAILARTDGNPFYVRETARLLASEGTLVATADVPAGVRDVIRRRLARLPAHALTVLRLASVVGRDVDVDVLLAADRDDEDAALDAVEAGLMAGLLVEPATGRLRFAHALVRDTLYDDVSRLRRTRLHARVAEAIEQVRPRDVAGLAHHFREAATAGYADKALDYTALAAEQAESRYAFGAAAELWEQAVDLHGLCRDATTAELVEVLIRLVRALARTGNLVAVRDVRQRAIEEAASTGDPRLVARAATCWDVAMFWGNRRYGENDAKVLDWIETALEQLPLDDVSLRARLLTTRAFETEGTGDPVAAESAVAAVELARGLGEPDVLALALLARYWTLYGPHPLQQRRAVLDEMHAVATEHELSGFHLFAHYGYYQLAFGVGDLATARREADQALELARRYRLRDAEVAASFVEPLEALVAGDYDEAERRYEALYDVFAAIGAWNIELGMRWACPLTVRHAQGRLAEMEEAARRMVTVLPAAASTALVRVLLDAGQEAEARRLWEELPPQRPDLFWQYYSVLLAESAVLLGDDARAEELYEALLPFSGELAGASSGIFTFGPLDATLAELAEHLGRPDQAVEHWERALELARRVRWPQCVDQAEEALRRLGDAESA